MTEMAGRPVLAGREPSPSPARGLPGRLRRHGDREETQSRSRQGRGHRGLPSPAAGPASPIGALRGDVTRAPGSRLAAAAARLSRPPPRPRPPRRRRGRPCTLAPGIAMCSQLRGRPRLPAVSPRSDSASAARARPRRLPSASPGLRRRRLGRPGLPRAGGRAGGREQRTAPAAMRGECGPGPRPARAPAFSAHSRPSPCLRLSPALFPTGWAAHGRGLLGPQPPPGSPVPAAAAAA